MVALNKLAEVVTLPYLFARCLAQISDRTQAILKGFYGFPQFFQAGAGRVPQTHIHILSHSLFTNFPTILCYIVRVTDNMVE
jgi:hypothetical protein